jgi:hypothetical protein
MGRRPYLPVGWGLAVAYRYGYDEQDLFVEQGTERVPQDGQFYIVLRGQVVEAHPTSKRALARLMQVRFAVMSGGAVASDPRAKAMQEEITRGFLSDSSREKHAKVTRKGGKGR